MKRLRNGVAVFAPLIVSIVGGGCRCHRDRECEEWATRP